MRVFINGFGRIGRSVLRAFLLGPEKWPGLEIVGINDIAAPEMCAYLFEYDSRLRALAGDSRGAGSWGAGL
jgi:glyceraldehyde 3-phosphate dehydrogenase